MPRTKPGRPCPEPGCPSLMPCAAHIPTPWRDRPTRRPDDPGGTVRKRRNARIMRLHDGVCHVCGLPGANEIDHIIPVAEGGGDDAANLAPIHAIPCHREKTQAEAARGRAARRATPPV